MSELSLRKLVKVYPFKKPDGLIFGRKRAREILERQRSQPYTTNEGVLALQDFSLEVEHGEFIVLLGPSGCGKSTILRMIAGLEEVSAGEILLNGEVINDLPPEQRDMAMIFQNYSLYPNYTVYENIAFPLKTQHVPREELDRQVRDMAETLELTALLQKRPKELSGGECQRVAMGRALIRRPRLFLLDEPFSNLDPILKQKLRVELKRLHRRLGTTFFYVTHDQADAFALADRIVVLQNGILEQEGTPRELYNRPKNLYVASFIGSPPINILHKVPLKRTDSGWQLRLFGENFPLPENLPPEWENREATVGVRPVHVVPAEEGIPAVVERSDQVEGEQHLYLRVYGQELASVLPISAHAPGIYRNGQRLSVQLGHFLLFDPETGENILA